VPLRALDASGSGRAWDIAAAFAWAADHGARVVDASLSGIGPSRVMADGATPTTPRRAGHAVSLGLRQRALRLSV
jgi:fructose-1,6-bisphosphatase/inositol monophosphatase family enzyme